MKTTAFKNFIPFTVPPEFVNAAIDMPFGDGQELGEQHKARDPEGSAWRAAGLINSAADGYFHGLDGAGVALTIQINERILPSAVRDEHLQKRVAEIEERQGFKLGRKDYAQLKDEVIFDLLPKAFIKRNVIQVIVAKPHWLFVFTSSQKRAEDCIALLNGVFSGSAWETYRPRLVTVKSNPVDTLNLIAKEVRGDEDRFEADNAAVLRGENKRTIRIKDRDIYGHEVGALLTDGYDVHELAINYYGNLAEVDPTIGFVLNDKLAFKRVVMADVLTSGTEGTGDDAAATRHAYSWLIVTTLRGMLDDLFNLMGGIAPPADNTKPAAPAATAATTTTTDEDDEL